LGDTFEDETTLTINNSYVSNLTLSNRNILLLESNCN
jgi:hypothetical protein